MNVTLDVRGKIFNVKDTILKKSPYFETSFDWNGIDEMEIDNDPDEFEQFLNFLQGKVDHPGVLGDFYMVGSGIPLISKEKNIVENIMKPYSIQTPSYGHDPFYMFSDPDESNNVPTLKMVHSYSHIIDNCENGVLTLTHKISNVIDWIDNFRIITNRKVKHVGISYTCDRRVSQNIFYEPHHEYMSENLKNIPSIFFGYVYQEVILTFKVTVSEGTYDPWVQIIYDTHITVPEIKKSMSMPNFYIHYLHGTYYSNLSELGKCMPDIKYDSITSIRIPLKGRISIYKYKKYIGKISEINFLDHYNVDFYRVYISKSQGAIKVKAVIDGFQTIPFCDLNDIISTNYGEESEKCYCLKINALWVKNLRKYLILDKEVDVWIDDYKIIHHPPLHS